MGKLEQDIANKEAELANLKEQKAKKDNGTKYVVGAMIIELAKKEPDLAKKVVGWFDSELNRRQDKERVLEFNNELRSLLNMPELILDKPVRKKKVKEADSVAQDNQDNAIQD